MSNPPTTELRPEEENKIETQGEDKLKRIKNFLSKFTYTGYGGQWIQETRGALLVVATVIMAMCYQPVLSPPGGLWENTVTDVSVCGIHRCIAGKSILANSNGTDYMSYMTFNTICFCSSLATILILLSGVPLNNRLAMSVLGIFISVTLVTLALSYNSALYVITPDHVFLNGYSYMILPIHILVGIICGIVAYHFVRSIIWIVSHYLEIIRTKLMSVQS